MKKKILFINPSQSAPIGAKCTNFKIPLGFIYMAGSLEKKGFEVKILDCPLHYKKRRVINKESVRMGLFPSDVIKQIKDFNPDIVGVSCAYTAFEKDSFETIKAVRKASKEMKKKILIVVGGAHTSANSKFVLRNKDIDIAVLGEGEETILEIAEKYQKGKSLTNILGTATIDKGKFKENKRRDYIQNLDALSPAWHLLELPLYFDHPDNSWATMRSPTVDIVTSRGCPGNCVFCSIHTVWGHKWRARSAKNVVDEIEMLVKKYGVRQFRMQDDNISLDKKRIIEICDEIVKRKLDIKWDTPNGVAIWTLNEEVIGKMAKAGCYRITFGIESACLNTQKYVRKVIDFNKIRKIIDICHKKRMWVCSTFIIGFPYEKKEDIEETRNFILTSKINFPFIYVAQPYLGTDMYKDFQKEGLMKGIKYTSHIGKSKYNTLYLKNEELNNFRDKLYKEFYIRKSLSFLNPVKFYKEFLSKIKSFEDLRYILKNVLFIALRG
ncbi:B12-binding domain-containing radical SAM protein [Nanoarchaeota archaeon]